MQYSPARRTALVLCGTGAHGAYHAGALRALEEAGVKIDIVAGQGIGAGAAMLAAIDGAARLWEPGGIWRASERGTISGGFYGWRRPIRIAGWLTLLLILVLVAPLGVLGAGVIVAPLAFLRAAAIVVASIVLVLAAGVLTARIGLSGARRRTEAARYHTPEATTTTPPPSIATGPAVPRSSVSPGRWPT